MFLIPVIIGFWASIISCFLLPKVYESSTLILVQEEDVLNPLLKGIAISTRFAERLRTIREQIISWNRLVQVVNNLEMAKNAKSQAEFEKVILGLRKNISVSMRGPNLINLAYQGSDPARTQNVIKAITDIFIEENVKQKEGESDVAITFLTDQLDVYKHKIKEAEIAGMEDQLKNLLLDSTEAHPLVKELREKVTKAKEELNTGNFKVETSVAATNPIYEELRNEVSQIEANTIVPNAIASEDKDLTDNLYKLMLIDKMDTVLARDARVNENIYNTLLNRLETAKITKRLETSKEGTRYTVLDPPRFPHKPVKPNKILVVFLGVFLGGFAGLGTAIGAEFMDHSFLEIDEAKESLSQPVLGAISKIATVEDIESEKNRKNKMIKVIVVISAVLLVILILFSILHKV